MKVYLIAAVTADGYIARTIGEHINWTSPEDKKFFREMTKQSGIMVMGGNTFRTLEKPLPDRKTIVYTRSKIDVDNVSTTQEPPEDLVERLKKEGYDELAVCGGSSIYSQFLKAGVVTDVYLTIEPLLFGTGIKLTSESLDISLELLESKKLNQNSLLLHYKVIK